MKLSVNYNLACLGFWKSCSLTIPGDTYVGNISEVKAVLELVKPSPIRAFLRRLMLLMSILKPVRRNIPVLECGSLEALKSRTS